MAGLGVLGRLPPELRNEIFAHVLVEEGFTGLSSWQGGPTCYTNKHPNYNKKRQVVVTHHHRNHKMRDHEWKHRKWVPAEPSKVVLLRVSKQLHAETAPILYGKNSFILRTP
ncbi:hypothetical protein Q7P37_011467 [Cladosporium fusiforme]